MHHTKLMVFGMVLVVVVIFGTIFWGDLVTNQQELANTPMPQDQFPVNHPSGMSNSDTYEAIEADLTGTEIENLDAESSQMDAEINAI